MESVSEIQSTAEELKTIFHPHVVEDVKLIQSSLMLYRQGMVTQLKIENDVVTAKVQDVNPVKIELDLSLLQKSECTCPNDGLCRHLMAAFFTVFSQVASVAEWMEEWREPIRETKTFSKWGIQKAKDLLKANGVLKPDYERWIQSFEESFHSLLKTKKFSSPYVVSELFEIYLRKIQAGAPAEKDWNMLYGLVANLISFIKLAELSEELGHSEEVMKRSYQHQFHQLIERCEDLVFKISLQTLPFALEEFIEKFKNDSFKLLICSNGIEYERIYLYRILWEQLFKKREWRENEVEKIFARMKDQKDENWVPLAIAGIHINVLIGNDEKAVDLIDHIDDDVICPFILYWIDILSGQKAWKRVGPYVELLLQKIKKYLVFLNIYHSCSSFTRIALKSIRPYFTEMERADLYEKALLQMLPYSFYEYEQLLFGRGQFDRWGELQAFIGFHYSDLPKDRIKVIEKEMPQVLMPLLHQSAQHEISLKNRQSYRQAVRYLKKLRTLYKKMKRIDEWNFFIATLIENTKRLRAFHEECKRSKLIDA